MRAESISALTLTSNCILQYFKTPYSKRQQPIKKMPDTT